MQSYESDELEVSLLLIPIGGFLPTTDPRVAGTVAALERELLVDGFLQRASADSRDRPAALGASRGRFSSL